MARRRKASDEINNLRKRWKRAAAKAERLGQTDRAVRLREIVDESKYDRRLGRYGTSTRGLTSLSLEAEGLRGLVNASKPSNTRRDRSNRAFVAGLQAARQGIPNESTARVGSAASMEYSVFMLSTRGLWENVPGGSRNALAVVATQLGMTYQDAYEFVLSQNAEALRKIDEMSAQLAEYDRMQSLDDPLSAVLSDEFSDWYNSVSALVEMMR